MPRAADEGQRIVEQVFLHHVIGRNRIAQRADHQVRFTQPQSREQVFIGAIDDGHPMARVQLRELEQRRRK
jgi:hypothetical protein